MKSQLYLLHLNLDQKQNIYLGPRLAYQSLEISMNLIRNVQLQMILILNIMSQYRPSYNNSRVQRSANGKPSYSPGNWKNYIISDNNKKPEDNRSSRDSAFIMRTGSPINSSYYQVPTERQQKQRKKEQMMRRVKNIQDRVMPLINNENHISGGEQIGWRNKMEQKVARLETAVDAVQKQLQIRMEKQVMQLQRKMMEKYLDLEAMLQARGA